MLRNRQSSHLLPRQSLKCAAASVARRQRLGVSKGNLSEQYSELNVIAYSKNFSF